MKNFNERIMMKEQTPYLTIDSINTAREKISTAAKLTPLQESFRLSKVFDANIDVTLNLGRDLLGIADNRHTDAASGQADTRPKLRLDK